MTECRRLGRRLPVNRFSEFLLRGTVPGSLEPIEAALSSCACAGQGQRVALL